MANGYVKATKETIPLAENKIVHDRFHVMQLATKAVDKVRRCEHKKLKSEGDERLTHSRYIWLKSQENLTENQRDLLMRSTHSNWKRATRRCYVTFGITPTVCPRQRTSMTGTNESFAPS